MTLYPSNTTFEHPNIFPLAALTRLLFKTIYVASLVPFVIWFMSCVIFFSNNQSTRMVEYSSGWKKYTFGRCSCSNIFHSADGFPTALMLSPHSTEYTSQHWMLFLHRSVGISNSIGLNPSTVLNTTHYTDDVLSQYWTTITVLWTKTVAKASFSVG